jgi:hypothetical protein
MKLSSQRDLRALRRGTGLAWTRFLRALNRILLHREESQAHWHEIPVLIAIASAYYSFFAASAICCYLFPSWMAVRFRV